MTIIPFATTMAPEEADAWRHALRSALPDCRIRDPDALSDEDARDVRVAIVANPDPVDLARFPALEWVQSLWAGVERLAATLPSRISIVRLVDPALAETMAEGVLGHVLHLHRRMPDYLEQQRSGLWRQLEWKLASERCVAVLGLGELGRVSARRLAANGFRVLGWSGSAKTIDGVRTFAGESGLREVLEEAEIVVVLLPLTDATRGLLDARTLDCCRPGASIVNVARGPIVETGALLAALDTGAIGHAILDVFETEPLPPDDPLWSHPSVILTPHVAAPTSMESASTIAARNIQAYLEDGTIPRPVDRIRGY